MTALFRAIGAMSSTFDGASKISGVIVSATVMYNGYMITKPEMHPWFVWLYWIDPLSYGFEALLGNEYKDKILPCVGNNLVPTGPGYADSAYQSCTGVGGAVQGQNFVTGEAYLHSLSYSSSHVWRNFGILWAWWALFVGLTIYSTSRWRMSSENGPSLLIPRETLKSVERKNILDEEALPQTGNSGVNSSTNTLTEPSGEKPDQTDIDNNLIRNTSVFTWKNLSYTVKTPSGDRLLLDNVQGWVKPGMLGALMGASGAGKTTLLDVLVQRKTEYRRQRGRLEDGRRRGRTVRERRRCSALRPWSPSA